MGITSIVFILVVIMYDLAGQRRHHDHSRVEAINNLRQIGIALFEFEAAYGKFPDADTVAGVRLTTKSDLEMDGISSNAYFQQMLGAEIAQSETMFYANVRGLRKPDNNFTRGEALKKGECGFTYFLGGKSTDNPMRPLAATPMIQGTDRFDTRKGFYGYAVILRMDCSVVSLPLDNDGHVIIDGKNMMDPYHPIWEGHPPTIAWPDL